MEAERQKGIDAEKQLLRGQTLAGKAPQKEKPSAGSGRLQAPEIVDSASLQFATDDEGEGGVSMEGEGLAVDAKEGKMQSVEAASLLSPTAAAAAKAAASGLAADIQKKLQRAERFGMPVQLSEEEKRNSRAERFGMGGSTIPGKSEELKRKARADRFGLAAQPTRDEDEKKKARLARFGEGPAPDNLEQEKRKARAARFSQAAPSDSNGQDKSATVETK